MSLEPQLAALLNQQFAVQTQPANPDPDVWQGESWVNVGVVLGRMEQFRDPPPPAEGGGPSTGSNLFRQWRVFIQPTATDVVGATIATLNILTPETRLVGPSPESRVFSVEALAQQYDDTGLHHIEVAVSEVE